MNRRSPLTLGPWTLIIGLFIGCGATPTPKPAPEKPALPSASSAEGAATTTPAPPPPPPKPVELTDEEKRALIVAGQTASLDGDLSLAEKRFREATDLAPDLVEARYNLGVLAEWEGRYSEAQRQYQRALDKNPEFAPAVVAIGRLMMRDGDANAALDFAGDALAASPKSIPLRNALNRLRVAARRDLSAVESESKVVLREDEKNVEAMINLAADSLEERTRSRIEQNLGG